MLHAERTKNIDIRGENLKLKQKMKQLSKQVSTLQAKQDE